MLSLEPKARVYLCTAIVDMRKSIDGLCSVVLDELEGSPKSGDLFIFCNRSRNKVKCLCWDKNGFVLHYKRLDRGRFQLKHRADSSMELTSDQLDWLLAGLDFSLMDEFSHLNYGQYY